MTDRVILGFDTSGPYCGTALFVGDNVVSAMYENMVKGQAEALMPFIEQTLAAGGLGYPDLTHIAVGIGPGNFTGIRVAVSVARGLSLSLGIPATGVNLFDALTVAAPLPIFASIQASRNDVYVSEIHAGWRSEPQQVAMDDIQPPKDPDCVCIGHRSHDIADHLRLTAQPAMYAPASAIARYVAAMDVIPTTRPTPFYLKPADAAPPRDPAPVILD